MDKKDAQAIVISVGIKSLMICLIGGAFILLDKPAAVAVCAVWASTGTVIILKVEA